MSLSEMILLSMLLQSGSEESSRQTVSSAKCENQTIDLNSLAYAMQLFI